MGYIQHISNHQNIFMMTISYGHVTMIKWIEQFDALISCKARSTSYKIDVILSYEPFKLDMTFGCA